jgi:hypothetical protein
VELEIGGRNFLMAVEYESSRKYADRYDQLFESYYANSGLPGVLYICRDSKLLSRVRNIELSVGAPSGARKIYYSDCSQWDSLDAISFTNADGATIRLEPGSFEVPFGVSLGTDHPNGSDNEVQDTTDELDEEVSEPDCGLYVDARPPVPMPTSESHSTIRPGQTIPSPSSSSSSQPPNQSARSTDASQGVDQ